MWMVAAIYRRTLSTSQLVWFENWRSSGAQTAFIIFYYDIFVLTVHAFVDLVILTFCMSRRRREMYCGHAHLCVCLSMCVSVRGRMPTLLHGPGCNLGEW